jgi:hypothetical protein
MLLILELLDQLFLPVLTLLSIIIIVLTILYLPITLVWFFSSVNTVVFNEITMKICGVTTVNPRTAPFLGNITR